jgi:hypothetical protein
LGFKKIKMEVGEKYLSDIKTSSGRTYEIISIADNKYTNSQTVRMKDVNSEMTITYGIQQIQEWIDTGRLKLTN